jgi:hypothetical protein
LPAHFSQGQVSVLIAEARAEQLIAKRGSGYALKS